MTASELLKKHGITPTKSVKVNAKIKERAADINKQKTAERAAKEPRGSGKEVET